MENCLARSLQYKPFEDRLCDVTGLHRNYQLREIITNTSFPFSLHSVAFFSHPRVCGHHPTRQLPDWPTCMSPSLSVCQFSRMISQKPMQLGSPNLTHKCSIMNHGNASILGSKGQRSRSRDTKNCADVGSCTLLSAAFLQ